MKLAVIPARGGSKRIPRKNIKYFYGKPIIAWSIEAAQKSGCFDHIIISTDDEEIAEVARTYGGEVPFLRPPELADDYTGTIPVIKHAIEWFAEQGFSPDLTCCIYATAPFVSDDALRRGLQLLQSSNGDYAFSVTSYPSPIQRAIKINQLGMVEMFQPDNFNRRSQDLIEAYHDAGQFYWGKSSAWKKEKQIFSARSIPIVLPRHMVQDIDTLEDWHRAEWMFRSLQHIETL